MVEIFSSSRHKRSFKYGSQGTVNKQVIYYVYVTTVSEESFTPSVLFPIVGGLPATICSLKLLIFDKLYLISNATLTEKLIYKFKRKYFAVYAMFVCLCLVFHTV